MQEISMLKSELLDQYRKCKSGIQSYQSKIDEDCLRGYISSKKIKGKTYNYLQWMEDGNIKSKYINPEHLNILQENIQLRKKYESSIKRLESMAKEIENFVGADLLREYFGHDI